MVSWVWADTLYVGSGQTYATIQAAINAAAENDVIQISEGTFTEALSIGKSLTLIGSGPSDNPTTIITSTASPIVQLSATGKSFTFQNLIVEGNSANLGIRAGSSINIESFVMEDVIARNCKVAVYFSENTAATYVNNLSFDGVTITNNAYIGAYIGRSVANGVVQNSTFSYNGYSDVDSATWQKCGIQFIDFYGAILPKVQVNNCTFINNGVGASTVERSGLVLYSATSTLSANPLMTVSGCSFTDHPQYAVRIRDGYYVHNTATVEGTFTNNYLDIWFSNMDGESSSTTNIRRSYAGIRSVGPDQRYDYNTITAALTAANSGDVINVASGTYAENVVINKSVTINGANADTPFGSRNPASVIAPASGLPVSIVADNVTLNGFEITGPGYQYGINITGSYSNVDIKYNYLHHIGTTITNTNVHALVYQVANAVAPQNLSITDNKFQYVSSSLLTGYSAAAIGILHSASTGTLTGLNILRNTISDVEVNTGTWPTGKLAYGIVLNTGGGSSYLTTTGKLVNVAVEYNQISNIKGFIATGIGMEGNTENAVVRYNEVSNLTAYKLAVRAEGGYDMNALKFESNRYVGSVTVTGNVLRADTFIHNGTPGLGYAVSNYVPTTVGTLNMTGNWYGTAVLAEIMDNDALTGKLFSKAGCAMNFLPYSTSDDPLNTLGMGPVVNTTQNTSYLTIQSGINAAAAGDVITVAAGTYHEDVDVNKSITLRGADAATAVIDGVWGGNSQTVMINANNATVENFTITRTGNNATDWNNAALNSTGLQIQNSRTGCVVQNCIFTGNRNAVYLNDTRDHVIQNNIIDFNRTGLQLVNNVSGVHVLNNQITNNWTMGVLIYHQSAGQPASTGVLINNNNISGNWYSQIECKIVQPNPSVSYDCTENWLGLADPFVVDTLAGEPGYSGQIPVAYGGTSESPGTNDGKISGQESFKILYDPWWANAAMTLVGSNAPVENVTQNTFYQTIQEAIDAADDNDHITVAAGTFDQTMNFVGKTGLTITGAGEGLTFFQPSTAVPWNYFGHTTGRRAAIRIVESQNITIEGITLDCDLIKNNGWHGVFLGNSTGCVLQNNTMKNMYTDQAHYYDVMIYARALEPFSNDARATLSILDCDLIDTGRVGIVTHDYMHTVIDGNLIYKTTNTFGYGMEIGSSSTAVVTDNVIHGFDTPAVSDGSTSGGIYIENAFTTAFTSPVQKPVTIAGNNIYDCQVGITVGNQFNNYAGNVDIAMQINNNILTDNISYGIQLTDEDKANGSSVTAVLNGNNISSTLGTVDAMGIIVYSTGDGDLDVSLVNNVVDGYDYSLFVFDWGADPNSSAFVTYASGNTFSGAEYGIYTGLVNWIPLRLDNPYFAGNTFEDNTIHMENIGNDIDMDAIVAANTFVGGAYKFDQIIYSSSADIVYMDAASELIQDNEQQTYSVKALTITDLRAFTVQVKVPKAYFAQPTDFAIGPLFSAYPDGTFFMTPMIADADYWIYNVTGSYLGGYNGIDGSDVVLFSFNATSLPDVDNTPDGCLIEVPFDQIELRDDQDPYGVIGCLASEGFLVVIDSGEPAMDHTNDDVYPTGYLLSVLGDGSGLLDRPVLNFTFTDNYDLDYTMYLIQPELTGAPTTIGQFADALDVVDGLSTDVLWQLAASVDALADGTYTVYYLVVDDAGNFSIYDWDFIIDSTPPDPIVWDATIPCRTTARQNNSIDLKWANPAGTVKNHIWVKSYATLPDASGYPEYAPASDYTVPAAPNPYSVTEQNGWNQYILIDPPAAGAVYPLTFTERGYYYITIFAADASGNISAAPVNPYYRESISYWPGDVTGVANGITHTVTSADIGVLSPVWALTEADGGWNNIVDVGPTVDNGRRSRPEPDNVIDIEDLMIFAMNYNNTVYTYYQREGEDDLPPIRVEMQYAIVGDKLNVSLYLLDNPDYVRGVNIPLAHGSGLSLDSVLQGDLWPENSLLLHKDKEGLFVLSGTVLGDGGAITGNGLLATVVFKTEGPDNGIELRHMIARGIMNEEMEILNNPNDITTPTDDPVNVVPPASYLGENYPNPFNPSTTVRYGLSQPGSVRISVYNARGQHIRTLVNGSMAAGNHTVVWNGIDDQNRTVSSGIYFIRMETKDCVSTKKALMVK